MMPSALRPLVVPFASARKGSARMHIASSELHGSCEGEAKYCNPWKLWTRQNAVLGRDPYPWTSSYPCVTFQFLHQCDAACPCSMFRSSANVMY